MIVTRREVDDAVVQFVIGPSYGQISAVQRWLVYIRLQGTKTYVATKVHCWSKVCQHVNKIIVLILTSSTMASSSTVQSSHVLGPRNAAKLNVMPLTCSTQSSSTRPKCRIVPSAGLTYKKFNKNKLSQRTKRRKNSIRNNVRNNSVKITSTMKTMSMTSVKQGMTISDCHTSSARICLVQFNRCISLK